MAAICSIAANSGDGRAAAGHQGRFILSLNDRPEVRRIFEGFAIEAVPVRYTVGGMAQSQVVGEVIISN
jgi:DNA adenine methylase